MEFVVIICLCMLVSFAGGFFVGEASCMNTYTEELEKRQRAFEKKLMKMMRG